MLFKRWKTAILMDQIPNEGSVGGSGYDTKPIQPPTPATPTPPPEASGVPAPPVTPPEIQKETPAPVVPAPPAPPTEVVPPVVPPVEVPPVVVPPPAPAEVVPPVAALELNVEGLDKVTTDNLTKFATKHNLSKEATQALADAEKARIIALKADDVKYHEEIEKAKVAKKNEWAAELRADPVFGGEKFAHNVHRVNKLLSNVMKRTEKLLTTNNNVLPPDIMRDLNDVANLVYGTESHIAGDDHTNVGRKSPLDFYTN